jgi:hypothetical protein
VSTEEEVESQPSRAVVVWLPEPAYWFRCRHDLATEVYADRSSVSAARNDLTSVVAAPAVPGVANKETTPAISPAPDSDVGDTGIDVDGLPDADADAEADAAVRLSVCTLRELDMPLPF